MHAGFLRNPDASISDVSLYSTKIAAFIASFLSTTTPCCAENIPVNAKTYIPMLQVQIAQHWPELTQPAMLAGQIEQETCISLTRPGCWNPHTELKTSYEYGFGLGQLTVTNSMNAFTALSSLDPSFKTWKWTDRYDPFRQLQALVQMDLQDYRYFTSIAATDEDNLAMMLSAYNGGPGGVLKDIKYCQALPGCDHSKWFGNIAEHSYKSTIKRPGYGHSAYEINRIYVDGIIHNRMLKYIPYLPNNSSQ